MEIIRCENESPKTGAISFKSSQLNIVHFSDITLILISDTLFVPIFCYGNAGRKCTFWYYLLQICIIYGANLALIFVQNSTKTALFKGAFWDKFSDQHQH